MRKSELAPIIIGKLLNIGGMLEKRGNRILQPFGLNQQQFSILFSIQEVQRVQQKDIINKLVLDKAHVSKVVKKLHQMKLIGIEEHAEDKRSSWLVVTEKGKEVAGACRERIHAWNSRWTAQLSSEDLHSLLGALDSLQRVFKDELQNDGTDS